MEPSKNSATITRINEYQLKINEIIKTIKSNHNSDNTNEAINRLKEANMYLQEQINELS